MSGQKWPLGSEVKRKDLTGGVMLYDASRAGNAAAAWFDPAFWLERNEVEGEARGRGTTHFVRTSTAAACTSPTETACTQMLGSARGSPLPNR